MAAPSSFDESNAVLGKPVDMSHDECDPLSILRAEMENGLQVVFSCWKLTADELEEVNRTGRIWLGICGRTMPPAFVCGQKPF